MATSGKYKTKQGIPRVTQTVITITAPPPPPPPQSTKLRYFVVQQLSNTHHSLPPSLKPFYLFLNLLIRRKPIKCQTLFLAIFFLLFLSVILPSSFVFHLFLTISGVSYVFPSCVGFHLFLGSLCFVCFPSSFVFHIFLKFLCVSPVFSSFVFHLFLALFRVSSVFPSSFVFHLFLVLFRVFSFFLLSYFISCWRFCLLLRFFLLSFSSSRVFMRFFVFFFFRVSSLCLFWITLRRSSPNQKTQDQEQGKRWTQRRWELATQMSYDHLYDQTLLRVKA